MLISDLMVQPFTCVWSCWRKWMGPSPYEASQKCPQLINRAQHVNENFSKATEKSHWNTSRAPHPHTQDKKDFHAHNDFFLVSDSYGQAQSKFSLSGWAWVGSVSPQRGKCLLRNRPNGVSKWCLSEHGLGTAGEQFNDLSGSAGESQGCSFPHKLFQGDVLKPGVPVTWLIIAMRHIPGISASSCRSGMWGPLGYPAQTPTADGAFLHCCLGKSLRVLVLCQGMMKTWVLDLETSSTPEPARWRSHLLPPRSAPPCLSHVGMNKIKMEATGGLGATWPTVLPSATREVVTSYTTEMWLTRRSVTLLKPVGTAEEKALLSSVFKVHFSLGSTIWLNSFSNLCLVRIRRET